MEVTLMKSINFMGDNGFKKALESVGVTASSSISSEKISGCFKYVTADDMCIITGYCGDSHIEVLELPFELKRALSLSSQHPTVLREMDEV